MEEHHVTERRACRVLHVNRTAYRYQVIRLPDEDDVRAKVIQLVASYGRVGYRMVTAMMNNAGTVINHKRVERIWREEGLQLPKKQTKKQRIWLNDYSCIRLRPDHRNHVWSYDFVEDKTIDGRKLRFLNIIDEAEHECLACIPRRSWRTKDIIEVLADLMILRGCPEYLRSDNGTEFTATALKKWLLAISVTTAYIEPGSPWENGYCESFNARMRDEFLKVAILDMVAVCVDDAVHIEDIAWNLVDAMTTVAVALGVVIVAAAVIAPGTITLICHPAGVVQVGFFRYGDQVLAVGDVTLLLVCHENRLLSNSRGIRRSRSIRRNRKTAWKVLTLGENNPGRQAALRIAAVNLGY